MPRRKKKLVAGEVVWLRRGGGQLRRERGAGERGEQGQVVNGEEDGAAAAEEEQAGAWKLTDASEGRAGQGEGGRELLPLRRKRLLR